MLVIHSSWVGLKLIKVKNTFWLFRKVFSKLPWWDLTAHSISNLKFWRLISFAFPAKKKGHSSIFRGEWFAPLAASQPHNMLLLRSTFSFFYLSVACGYRKQPNWSFACLFTFSKIISLGKAKRPTIWLFFFVENQIIESVTSLWYLMSVGQSVGWSVGYNSLKRRKVARLQFHALSEDSLQYYQSNSYLSIRFLLCRLWKQISSGPISFNLKLSNTKV